MRTVHGRPRETEPWRAVVRPSQVAPNPAAAGLADGCKMAENPHKLLDRAQALEYLCRMDPIWHPWY